MGVLPYCVASSLAYRKSSNKPPGAYLHQETGALSMEGLIFKGGGLLLRLRIDMGGLFGYQKIKMGDLIGGGGGGIPAKAREWGTKILGEILGMSRGMLNWKIEGHIMADSFKPPWGLFEGGG